ncbi:MAG: polysaccharide deacetylase [Nitrospinota bacterium]
MSGGKVRWRGGARCAAMLSFDVDGETLWMARDPALERRPLHMGMGAYGPREGVPRILRFLDRYGLPATFFIPGWTAERYPDMVKAVVEAGHEVGHHGYLHEKPFFLSGPEEEERLLVRGLEALERVAGVKPKGSRTPSCDPSAHTMGLLAKHGILYHSNLMDADLPYHHPEGLVELPTCWPLDDFIFFGFSSIPPIGHGIRSPQEVYNIWVEEFEGVYEEGGFYNLMMHPQVIGRPHRMRMVERLVGHMLGKGDVWFCWGGELAEYWAEHNP